MAEIHKRVDESWKDRVEQEKKVEPAASGATGVQPAVGPPPQPSSPIAQPGEVRRGKEQKEADDALPEARFDLFVSGLAMDALIALGDVPHPVTKKQAANLEHARYLIDVLGVLEEKTKNNLTVDEARLMKDALYQLRMRYMAKAGG